MSDYVIRPLTVDEVQKVVDWAGREGWNPGHHDARCFHGTDTRGFLGGFLDGEMIASISVVQYDDAFAFLGENLHVHVIDLANVARALRIDQLIHQLTILGNFGTSLFVLVVLFLAVVAAAVVGFGDGIQLLRQ